MSSRALALRLVLAAGLSGIAAPLFADETVMDAEGRVFGDTVEDPLPEWKSPAMHQGAPRMLPPMPMAASMAPGGYPGPDLAAWEEQRADWLAECRQRFGGKIGKTEATDAKQDKALLSRAGERVRDWVRSCHIGK